MSDNVREKMAALRTIFGHIHTHNFSLSLLKTALFMSEVIFAGEHIVSLEIHPDLAKLTVVVD